MNCSDANLYSALIKLYRKLGHKYRGCYPFRYNILHLLDLNLFAAYLEKVDAIASRQPVKHVTYCTLVISCFEECKGFVVLPIYVLKFLFLHFIEAISQIVLF